MVDFAGAAEGFGGAFAETEVFDLACFFEFDHGLDGGFDGLLRIDAVAVVEVDTVDVQALEGLVACLADVGGFVADGAGAVGCGVIGEVGGEDDLVSFACSLEPSVRQVGLSMMMAYRCKRARTVPQGVNFEGVRATYFPSRSSLSPYMSAVSQKR